MKIILKQIDENTRIVLTNRLLRSASLEKCYSLERRGKLLFWQIWSTSAWIYADIMNGYSADGIEEWLYWSEGKRMADDISHIKKKFGLNEVR